MLPTRNWNLSLWETLDLRESAAGRDDNDERIKTGDLSARNAADTYEQTATCGP